MRWRVVLPALASLAAAVGAPPAPECAGCHPAEAKLHASSRMARAMVPASGSAFAQDLPDQPLHESSDGYSFLYRRTNEGIAITVLRGGSRGDGLIEWVLGAGAQGQTPLVRTGDEVLESRVSYFPQLHQYGITVGQDAGASPSAQKALGVKLNAPTLQSCIGCHATAMTRDLRPVTPGVQCQRCHAGADEHAQGRGKPFNPGKLDAAAQVRFCGNCHRVKPPVDDAQLENLRFQPLRLMKSRCFTSGKLACTTCHAAHQDARREDAAYYNNKCHACHDERGFHTDQRQTGDCIGCHMPYVELHPALHFTDHFIRVVKTNDVPASILRRRPTGS